MSEAVASTEARATSERGSLLPTMAWRNLWRNRRRTWLTSASIAFAIFLVCFTLSFQEGVYATMEDNGTSLLSGHLQVQNPRFIDDNRLEYTIGNATELMRRLEAVPGVTVMAPRVETFALVSAAERSFGALILGVDLERERRMVRLFDMLTDGRQFEHAGEAIIGSRLARNLELELGGELLVLGTAKEGGVAALAFEVVGIVASGIAELDRTLVAADIEVVREGFNLGDEVHTLAASTGDLDAVNQTVGRINDELAAAGLQEHVRARGWQGVLPDITQAIQVDRVGGRFLLVIIVVLVAFSVVNTFIMTVFDRTREFGMLLAIGMRAGRIQRLLMLEAVFLWFVGSAIGVLLAFAVLAPFAASGIDLGEGLAEMAAELQVNTTLYPSLEPTWFMPGPLVMLVGVVIGSFLPGMRIRRLKAVEALRVE